jgi:hypothetical protein
MNACKNKAGSVLLLALLGTSVLMPAATQAQIQAQTAAQHTEALPVVRPPMPELNFKSASHGQEAIRNLGDKLAEVAAHYGKTEKELCDQLVNDKSLWIDKFGHLFFVEKS